MTALLTLAACAVILFIMLFLAVLAENAIRRVIDKYRVNRIIKDIFER